MSSIEKQHTSPSVTPEDTGALREKLSSLNSELRTGAGTEEVMDPMLYILLVAVNSQIGDQGTLEEIAETLHHISSASIHAIESGHALVKDVSDKIGQIKMDDKEKADQERAKLQAELNVVNSKVNNNNNTFSNVMSQVQAGVTSAQKSSEEQVKFGEIVKQVYDNLRNIIANS